MPRSTTFIKIYFRLSLISVRNLVFNFFFFLIRNNNKKKIDILRKIINKKKHQRIWAEKIGHYRKYFGNLLLQKAYNSELNPLSCLFSEPYNKL